RGAAGSMKKNRGAARSTISSSSPLGMLALYLLEQWRQSARDGIVFLSEDENRAERLGSVLHSLAPSLDVLVFPRLNTLPFDGLEPSREIAGRRSSVLRRLAISPYGTLRKAKSAHSAGATTILTVAGNTKPARKHRS